MIEPGALIVTFRTTHEALKAEMAAGEAGIEVKMIPVPREISAECTMGMLVAEELEDGIRERLARDGIECVYVKPGEDGGFRAERAEGPGE